MTKNNMKPRFKQFLKMALPALIVVPAMTHVASAGTINPDTFGNITVPAGTYADTVQASGGTSSSPVVTIDNGATVNGDAVLLDGVIVSSAGYTIDNNGVIDTNSALGAGIDASGFAITVNNAGSISAYLDGITAATGTVVNNLAGGSIAGQDNAITVTGNATVDNAGTITGDSNTGGIGNGLEISGNLGLTNSGTITTLDGSYAVNVGGTATIGNTGSITAPNGTAVNVVGALTLTNGAGYLDTGLISGGTAGISGGAGSTVTNDSDSSITGGTTGVTLGANSTVTNVAGTLGTTVISGGTNGVVVGADSKVVNGLNASITGTTGNGITAASNGSLPTAGNGIVNDGTVTGGTNGVFAGDFALVENTGTITGTSGIGVRTGSNSQIDNTGLITGNVGIDAFGFGGTFVLNNTNGTVTGTGGVAIDGLLFGVDTLNLNYGSVINGDVNTRGGNDVITLSSVWDESGSVINGSIDAGGGADTINLTNSGYNDVTVTGDLIGGFGGATYNLTKSSFGNVIVGGDVVGGIGTDTLVFTGGKEFYWDGTNAVVGGTSLIQLIDKEGTGTAFIGSASLPSVGTDAITVNGGGLYINGDISPVLVSETAVTVASGAEFGGTGTWTAGINVAGGISAGLTPVDLTLAFNDSVGTINLTGNLNFAAGSHIDFNIDPVVGGAGNDLIIQNGTTTFAGTETVEVSPTNIDNVIQDGAYTIISSNNAIVGAIPTAEVDLSFLVRLSESGPFYATGSGPAVLNLFLGTETADGGTDLVLTVQHNYEGLGLTANQSAIGAAIDASVSSSDPFIQDFIAALDYSDLTAVEQTLAGLSPEGIFGLTESVINSNYRLHRQVQEHLAVTRSYGGEVVAPATAGPKGGVSSKGGMAPSTTCCTGGSGLGNVWGAVSYDWQDYSGDFATQDYDGETAAFTVGIDYRVAENFVLGAVLDGSTGDFDGNASSSDIDSLRGAIYGTYGAATGFYSDFLAGYGSHDLDQSQVVGGILNGLNSSSTDADSVQALLTFGYSFGDLCLKHGPFAGLEYQNVDVDGYTQNGPFPILVNGYDVDSLRGLIGYRVDGNFGTFRPYASVAYAHEFEDDTMSTTAFFGTAPFRVAGSERGSAILVTVGTGISLSNSLTLDVGYRGDISVEDTGVTSHGGSIGLNYNF